MQDLYIFARFARFQPPNRNRVAFEIHQVLKWRQKFFSSFFVLHFGYTIHCKLYNRRYIPQANPQTHTLTRTHSHDIQQDVTKVKKIKKRKKKKKTKLESNNLKLSRYVCMQRIDCFLKLSWNLDGCCTGDMFVFIVGVCMRRGGLVHSWDYCVLPWLIINSTDCDSLTCRRYLMLTCRSLSI